MKYSHLLLPLLAVLAKETQSMPSSPTAVWNHRPESRQQRLQRMLQSNSTTPCTFDAFVAGDCTYDEFCLPTEPNSAISCQGLPTSTWTMELVYLELCYDSFDDLEGDAPGTSELPDGGYCSTEMAQFTFDQQVLTNTAPYLTSILEEYNVVTCPDDSALPDYVFGVNYCNDGCPVAASMDGTVCTGTCTICADSGVGLLNCSNVDPALVYSCPSDDALEGDDDIYQEFFTYLEKGNEEEEGEMPNAGPVAGPNAAPNTAPNAEPSTPTTAEQPTNGGGDPVSPVTPVAPVAPSPTSSSGAACCWTSGLTLALVHVVVVVFSYYG